jgi:hypothetical protein
VLLGPRLDGAEIVSHNANMSLEKKFFGNTGRRNTRTVFGGATPGHMSHEESDRTLEVLPKHGVNRLDVASGHGDGIRIVGRTHLAGYC